MGPDPANPMQPVRRAKVDTLGRLRYLSPAEEQRVRAALEARDESRRDGRRRFNAWRSERGYKTLPQLGHLWRPPRRPSSSGAQHRVAARGAPRAEWGDVDLSGARLTVQGASAKSGLTRYVPLNSEALTTLQHWRACSRTDADPSRRFPGPDGRADVQPENSLEAHRDRGEVATTLHFTICGTRSRRSWFRPAST